MRDAPLAKPMKCRQPNKTAAGHSKTSAVLIVPVSRGQLCEFVASEFRFRGFKNGAAKGERSFVEPTGVEYDLLHRLLSVKLHHLFKLFPTPARHDAFDDGDFVFLQVNCLHINIPKQVCTQG
ncbi:MAG: hypothetical protein EPGJADBJ_04763 [Saprospiraceae bacterium]|nr:hypothetical protein [Saprospiraceae bacterium]